MLARVEAGKQETGSKKDQRLCTGIFKNWVVVLCR
jgi:hypothetical protein